MTDIIAIVNGQPLTRRDLVTTVQGYARQQHRKSIDHLSPEELRQARELALEKLLARELIYQAALAEGVVAAPEQIEAEQERIAANFPTPEEFYATLGKAGISPADYYRMLRQDLTVTLMSERQLVDLAPPTAEELEAAWQEHRDHLSHPLRIRASHILLRVGEGDDPAAIEVACRQLADQATPENFAALAKACSACPSAPGGGDLGRFRKGEMSPEFEEVAFRLPVGQVGGPVRTEFGWHLILVTERQEAVPLNRQEADGQLRRLLKNRAETRHLEAWVEGLRERAEIRIFDPELPWPASLSKES